MTVDAKPAEMTAGIARDVSSRAIQLYSDIEVYAALDEMAAAMESDLGEANPVLLCIMTGGIVTTSELALRLNFPLQIDYVHASRYGDATRGGELEWLREPTIDLQDRVVVLVDDIFDQGATLAGIADYCRQQGASAVHLAVLVDKQHDRKLTDLRPEYIALTVEDHYVYGFGMDYRGYLRNCAGIYAADASDC